MNDFRSIQDGVNLYSLSKIDTTNLTGFKLPTEGKLTLSDKEEISQRVPTLRVKVEELNPGKTIDDINLYWINEGEIVATLSKEKQDKGYIIDVDTKQIIPYHSDHPNSMFVVK
ncbi:hypothetical protein D3C71_1671450 [compost metagenome]